MTVRCEYSPPEPTLRHTVYICTLGAFEATKDGALLDWSGAGVGARQLRSGLSLLIARRGQSVCREALVNVSGARNICSGINTMLHRWNMDEALEIHRLSLKLVSRTSWYTDTDELQHLLKQAEQFHTAGDRAQHLATLARAGELCQGRYLPEYDSIPDYTIEDVVAYWQLCQKETLRNLAHAALAADDPRHRPTAIQAAIQAGRFDPDNPESDLFIAHVARRCGDEGLARRYEAKARRRSKPPPD